MATDPDTCIPPRSQIRVLLVENEDFIQSLIFRALASARFRVIAVAANEGEAITLARQYKPDLILLDVMMPRMSGLAAREHLRNEVPGTKIVVFSADPFGERIGVGVNAVLDKGDTPVDRFEHALERVLMPERRKVKLTSVLEHPFWRALAGPFLAHSFHWEPPRRTGSSHRSNR